MATVITPNIPEAEVLAEMEIRSEDDMVEEGKKIHEMYHCAVLCKGGHSLNDANDSQTRMEKQHGSMKKNQQPNTDQLACTLSSAIASKSAKDILGRIYSPRERIYQRGVGSHVKSGKGSEPMDHGFEMRVNFDLSSSLHLPMTNTWHCVCCLHYPR